jgi:hypothetical protein
MKYDQPQRSDRNIEVPNQPGLPSLRPEHDGLWERVFGPHREQPDQNQPSQQPEHAGGRA